MNIILKALRYLVWVQLMNQIHFVGAVRPHTEYRDTFSSVVGSADTTGKKAEEYQEHEEDTSVILHCHHLSSPFRNASIPSPVMVIRIRVMTIGIG